MLPVVFHLLAERIPFGTGRFQIEHQVLDVEPQLREGFLHESQNPSPAANRIHDLLVGDGEFSLTRPDDGSNLATEFRQFLRNLIVIVSR